MTEMSRARAMGVGGWGRVGETASVFLRLGLVSFGGPVAHLGYFRTEIVERRQWLGDDDYAGLVGLCQFLPGPASSQVVFALGMHRAGWLGAFVASLAFLLPSAVAMIAFALGAPLLLAGEHGAGVLHGLKLVAVPVVAHAVWAMGRKLCPDLPRMMLAVGAAVAVLALPGALSQVLAIGTGGLAGWLMRGEPAEGARPSEHEVAVPGGRRAGAVCLLLFALLLVLPMLALATWEWRALGVFDAFYRSGALVFGGGHVVLPLLRAEVVATGWMSDASFLAGYGAAQAVPGPLFSFAGFLGATIYGGEGAWLGGAGCLLAIFLPAWLLIAGVLPFWHRWRSVAWVAAAMRGANAAVVGVLLAALVHPVMSQSIRGAGDALMAAAGTAVLAWGKVPPWALVLLFALTGWLVG